MSSMLHVIRRSVTILFGLLLILAASPSARGQLPAELARSRSAGAATPGQGPAASALVVAVREAPPFAMRDATGQWTGLSVDLWKAIASTRSWNFVWRELPLGATLDALAAGEVDVAVAALTLTEERERQIDFSHAYYSAGLATAWSVAPGGAWANTLRSYAWQELLKVIGLMVVVLLLASAALVLFERPSNAEEFGGSFLQSLGAAFWWSTVTMTTVGYGDKTPRTVGGRLVAIVWMFASLIIVASFTGTIAATITVHRIDGTAQRSRPLTELRVGVVSDSSGDEYVISRGATPRAFADLHAALASLGQGQIDVVVHDAPILRHELKRERSGRIEIAPGVLLHDDYGFGLVPGSSLREDLNISLLAIRHSPVWVDLRRRHLGE